MAPQPLGTAHRGFQRLKLRALEKAIPIAAHLELTYHCNWRCAFCYNPRHFDLTRLSLADWCLVLDDLRVLGTLCVTLTGGEPLTRADFFEIAGAARDRALALKVFTNGSLVTEEAASRLAALSPLAVEMSLHGSSAATHDRATGKPGSFEALWAGVERLRKREVPLALKTPLTSLNEDQLDDMIALAAARRVPLRLDPTITPRDDGDLSPLQYAPSSSGISRLLTRLQEVGQLPQAERSEGGLNCGLGRTTMAVDPEGNVYPCLQWRHSSMGNVRRTRLVELWHTADVRREAAEVARSANDELLRRGGAAARFPFCPALAAQRTGHPLRPDPSFLRMAEMADALRPSPLTETTLRAEGAESSTPRLEPATTTPRQRRPPLGTSARRRDRGSAPRQSDALSEDRADPG